jgi:hypothetical protein
MVRSRNTSASFDAGAEETWSTQAYTSNRFSMRQAAISPSYRRSPDVGSGGVSTERAAVLVLQRDRS